MPTEWADFFDLGVFGGAESDSDVRFSVSCHLWHVLDILTKMENQPVEFAENWYPGVFGHGESNGQVRFSVSCSLRHVLNTLISLPRYERKSICNLTNKIIPISIDFYNARKIPSMILDEKKKIKKWFLLYQHLSVITNYNKNGVLQIIYKFY